ncbi:hypothetical protein OGATHE_004751 [Ogataea polymorpha]|uniref:Uncharacterized protein n=1 Tax=Ogataea polymorpha TaxID=460523 RepID=A0A9P8P135_9ASCO|nr:hypothetical protein OGATHE_004751 [Ogataea polymorpha]
MFLPIELSVMILCPAVFGFSLSAVTPFFSVHSLPTYQITSYGASVLIAPGAEWQSETRYPRFDSAAANVSSDGLGPFRIAESVVVLTWKGTSTSSFLAMVSIPLIRGRVLNIDSSADSSRPRTRSINAGLCRGPLHIGPQR